MELAGFSLLGICVTPCPTVHVTCSNASGEVNRCDSVIKQDLYATAESTTSFYVTELPDSKEEHFS